MSAHAVPPGHELIVADEHTLLAEAIASAASRAGYSDVRVTAGIPEIVTLLNGGWKPSIFLLDFDLAIPNNFEALEELQVLAPDVSIVIMLSELELKDEDLAVRAFVHGAVGIVSKDNGVSSLLRVLEVVLGGQAAIPRSLARSVSRALRFGPALMADAVGLSPRQRQVLALVARGMTDQQIASHLAISLPTVRSHLELIFEKTHTSNRTAAARWAGQYRDETIPLARTRD